MVRMIRILSLILPACLVCALAYADTPPTGTDTSSNGKVVFYSDNPSRRILKLLSNPTVPYANSINVKLELDAYEVTLPQGYTQTGPPVLDEVISQDDLHDPTKAGALKQRLLDTYDRHVWRQKLYLKPDRQQRAFIMTDQSSNLRLTLGFAETGAAQLNQIAPASLAYPKSKWDRLHPTWHFQVLNVQSQGVTVSMGVVYIAWDVTVTLDLTKNIKTNLVTFTNDTGALDTAAAAGDATLTKADNPAATPETPAPAAAPATPPKTGAPAAAGAKSSTASAAAQSQGSGASVLSFFSDIGVSDISKLQGPNLDVVGGFAVHNRGADPFAGLVASFRKEGEDPRWYSLNRLGLLGGHSVGSNGQWIIAPTWKIGDKSFFYVGYGYSDSGGSNRSSPVIGLAFTIGGAIGAAVGNKSAPATPNPVDISVADEAAQLFHPESKATTKAVVITYDADSNLNITYSDPKSPVDDVTLLNKQGLPSEPFSDTGDSFVRHSIEPPFLLDGVEIKNHDAIKAELHTLTGEGITYDTLTLPKYVKSLQADVPNLYATDPAKGVPPLYALLSVGNDFTQQKLDVDHPQPLMVGTAYFIELNKTAPAKKEAADAPPAPKADVSPTPKDKEAETLPPPTPPGLIITGKIALPPGVKGSRVKLALMYDRTHWAEDIPVADNGTYRKQLWEEIKPGDYLLRITIANQTRFEKVTLPQSDPNILSIRGIVHPMPSGVTGSQVKLELLYPDAPFPVDIIPVTDTGDFQKQLRDGIPPGNYLLRLSINGTVVGNTPVTLPCPYDIVIRTTK